MSAPEDLYGPYRVLRALAAGGMGEVLLAEDTRSGDTVVLKRLLPHLWSDPEFVAMFEDEARITGALDHPNIVRQLDVFEDDGERLLVLEHVDGASLAEIIELLYVRDGFITLPEVAWIVRCVAMALDHAHHRLAHDGLPLGIIHRDVSPSNVLIDRSGAVKLADFGIARARDRISVTAAGTIKGKYEYMSPEAFTGDGLTTPASDLFALGAVTYEALTGMRAFQGVNDIDTVRRVSEARLPPPSKIQTAVPAEMDRLVAWLTDPKPDHRPARGLEIALAMDRFLVGAQPPAAERLARRITRLDAVRAERRSASRVDGSELPTRVGTSPARPRAMLVDPTPAGRDLVRRALAQRHELLELATAEEASERLQSAAGGRPVLVIARARLPGASGVDLLRFVRGDPELARLPFVLIRAADDDEAAARGFEAGADAVLVEGGSAEALARICEGLTA